MENNKMNWSRGPLRYLESCPACGQVADKDPKYIRQDDEGLMSDTWKIYKCKSCASTFVNPQPAEISLPDLYQDYLTHKPIFTDPIFVSESLIWCLIRGYLVRRFSLRTEKRYLALGYYVFMVIPPLRHKLDRYGRNLHKENHKTKGKLLDFGCGAGEFLEISDRMGWKTYGCDFDPVVVSLCQAKGFDVRFGDLTAFDSDERFDAITLNQVIEHVINPQKTIKDCFHALNRKGCLWIGTPNPNAYGATTFGSGWIGWHPPYHLCLPSQSELIRWMKEAGFCHVQVLQRGPHAKYNWIASEKLSEKYQIKTTLLQKSRLYLADFMNSFSPERGEETVIIGFRD